MLEQQRETRETGLEVAVIGMAGRFPGAGNIHEFWQNLENGVESITFFSDEELEEMGEDASFLENPGYIKARGYFAGIEYFDAAFFGYTPSEAAVMDPQIRFLHECAWEALEDAGCDPDTHDGLIGVYVGAADNFQWRSFVLWGARMGTGFEDNQFTGFLLSNKDILCSRLSYQLNLTGPSYTVNSACSTSMVAIHRGCRGLLGGECDMALAGGVSVTTPQKKGYIYQEGMIESADGHCRAFDARASGTVFGSGIGVVILKRLDEAVEQGNHIYAVIKGTAVNNDGKRKVGYTAPSVEGQTEVIRAAYQVAEVDPDTIGYIETHGTGTALGDPIEIKALVRGMNRTPGSRCPIGAVKTNVGHLDTAAGAAGFIKTVLCLKHRMIPPTLHFKTPNPELELEKNPFYVNTELTVWERQGNRPLRAAVSSFGIGGTNVHAILEEWREVKRSDGQKEERPQLILLSAKTAEALDKMTGNLANYLKESLINPVKPGFLGDVAYTLQTGRKAFVHRKALVCSTVEEAAAALSNPGSPLVQTLAANEEFRDTVFMFPGQGSQYVNMGRELYREEAVFRQEMDRCFDILTPMLGVPIKEVLYPGERQNRSHRSNKSYIPGINQTEITQPVIFAFEYALAKLLMHWGITPDAMIGYSFGEYAAACLAGVFSLEDVLALVVLRGRLMQKLSGGAMLSVPLPEEELKPLLDDGLSIAIVNEPACIVAGDAGAIGRFEEKMRERRLVCMRLHANFAVHTSLMDDAVEVFAARLRRVRLHKPRIPYISGITGDWIAAGEAVDYRYWLRHLRETIRFSRGIQCLLKEKRSIFIEIGPGRDLTVLVKRYIDNNAPRPVINLVRPSRKNVPDVGYLLRQVGRLWLYRREINWKRFHTGNGNCNRRYLVPLPPYPFERKRYWPDREYKPALNDDGGAAASGSDRRFNLPSGKRSNIRDTGNIHRRPELDTPYAAPENEIQRQLVQIWQRFFGLEAVGIDDDFFDLGGDSLKAGVIISRIHKKLGAAVSLAEIFDNPTVRQLSRRPGKAAEEEFISINPGEKKEYYALTPAQQRFYLMQQMHPGTTAYNISQVIPPGPGTDKKRIETTCKRLMESHESLRTAFIIVDDKPVQKVYDEVEFEIEFFDLATEDTEDTEGTEEERKKIQNSFIRPFDLSRPPLLRVGLVETAGNDYLLLVDMHHIISDGTSQMVLSGDFMSLYNGEPLEPIRLQYRDFSQWQNRMLETESGRIKADRVFWLETLAGKLPVLNIPTDFPRPRERSYAGGSFSGSLGGELGREVSRLGRQTNTTLYMVLLTALNILLFRYTGQEDIIIGSPSAGRNHTDLEKIIGLVIGTLMMRNFPSAEKPFREFLQEVKSRTLAAYEHHAYPFEEVLKKLDYREDPSRNPISDVALIVQNMFPAVPGESAGGVPGAAKLDFTIYALEQGEEIIFIVEYSTALFRRGTMERLTAHLGNILGEAVKNPEIPLGEIDLLTTAEKRELMGTAAPCFPLSHPQKRIYYTEKRYPHTGANNLAFTARYNRLLDRRLLEEAINLVLQRNEGLRLRLVEFDYFHDPFQYTAPPCRYSLEEVEVGLSGGLTEWIARQAHEPFDWINHNLFYFAYLKFNEKESGYYMKFHHLAADGWTILSLFKEIDEIYETLEAGKPLEVDTAPSYFQFISAENAYLNSPAAVRDREFWHRYLLPLPGRIGLLAGGGDNAGTVIEAGVCVLSIPGDVRTQIHRYCRARGTSIFKVMLSALSVYIWRVTGTNDFVIGSANHNRTTEDQRRMAGMFVSTVPFRVGIDEAATFAGLVEKTGKETGNILKNYRRYPFDLLMDELREKTGVDVGYLLDINLIGHPDMKGDKYRIEHHFPGYEPTPLSLHINGNNRDIHGILEMEWDFQLRQFSLEDIRRIHRGLVHILTDALGNPLKELRKIEWLSPEEKEQVIELFNRSGMAAAETFSVDKPLHRLFGEQAEKSGDGAALAGRVSITYAELNRRSDQLAVVLKEKGVLADDIVAIMLERSVEMIIGILGILKAGGAYLPIDPDYPRERIDYMLKDSGATILLTELPAGDKRHHSSNQFIIDHSGNLAYIIYTSGSTGNPRGVMVTHGNVVNYLNAFDWQFDLQSADIVVQQASYAFDAFVEEMYPVLLKGGMLAIPLKEEVTDMRRLVDFIVRHQVTVITCSPLMLSQLGRYPAIYGASIRTFISGGDRLRPEHIDNLLKIGKVFNTYGPTEATVCAAYYRAAGTDRAGIPIGKPIPGYRVYILDAYLQPVPAGVNGELCIAGAGVSRGYLNNPELTAEKFYRDLWDFQDYGPKKNNQKFLRGSRGQFFQKEPPGRRRQKLYRTGDLGRWLVDGNIEFTGRIDSQVNIRGYRIEPGEIENRLIKLETIRDALVVAREGKGGDIYLCAYIIPGGGQMNIPGIREYLLRQLPAYMVPGFFVEVESIPLTPNGKPDLEALPDPLLKQGDGYEPPADRTEAELVTLWSGVLGIPRERISVTANFFELGGHSLNAALLTAHIHKQFNVELSLGDVFKTPFIRELSRIIKGLAKNVYALIEPVEEKEYYALSSAQKRLYFLQQMDPDSIAYNMPLVLPLGKGIEKAGLESALKKLIGRHESLRTWFEVVKGEPVQRIHEQGELEIENYKSRIPRIIQEFVRPFALSKAPLIRSGLIEGRDGNHTWMVDIHHIVSDGTSHTVLAEDFTALYNEGELEPLRLQYKDFSGWQNRLFASGKIKKQEDYWLGLYAGEIPRLHLPADYKRPGVFTFAGAHYYFMPPEEDTAKFKALSSRMGGTLYMNIMAVLNTLCYKYTGQTDIIIGSGIAGRSHADLQRIIGMFVNTLAMRNFPNGEKTYEAFLAEVIAHSVEAFENQDVQFEELVERLDPERDPSRNPLFDISMVVQNFRRPSEIISIRKEPDQGDVPPFITTKFDMTFFTVESNGNVYFDVEYYTGIFKEETIRRLISHFNNIIKTVVDNPLIKLKDIDIMPVEERKQVLYEFNDTAKDYPGDKTIHQLLEEIVEKTPDLTAIAGKEKSKPASVNITYRELHEKSNQLANYLYAEKHIRPEEPVGISMTQPVALAVAVLGILKAGAAYVPLDPSLPGDRLKYMIEDAGIGMVIAEKRYIKTLNRLQWECDSFHSYLCMDSYDIHGEDEVEKSELMDEELWNHVGETAVDDIGGGGWISSYTGESFSREEMDEYGDNILTKLEPLLHPGTRALEIGCASGITMYRLAAKVGLYYGIDLSPVIIEWNRKKVEKEGHQNIKLSCLAAHEIHQIGERDFDLIIMNSVIQCFHGHHYLRKVIFQCIELLGERGHLFLGDIMDLEKRDALVDDLRAYKNAAKKDFSAELFISRGFWEDLGVESGVIAGICFSAKRYSIENELTRFRYDVLISVDKQTPGVGKSKWRKRKYQEDGTKIPGSRGRVFPLPAAADSLAYIIYTSGTTGMPKGVEVEHRSVVNTLCCRKAEYGMNSQDVALQLFSYGFDGFVTGFFTPLISGARLIVLSGEDQGDVDKIRAAIVRNGVTHFISVPPLYNALLESMTAGELSSLKAVTLAGDRVSVELLKKTREKGGHVEIVNEYGVTEAAVLSTLYRGQDRDNTVKIGRPIWNTQIFILAETRRFQPVGAAGELCIGGAGLARGYLNNPELTTKKFNKKFCGGPGGSFSKEPPGRRRQNLYKTGDLARWLADGTIEFLGRIDHQVKIRGFRIEPGEIESRLLKHEFIKEAVVTAGENEQGDAYLCAYVGSAGVSNLNNRELKEYLARTLPAYMVPRYIVPLDKIPLTSSGKPDRKKLPEPGFTPGESYVAPGSETEEKLAVIWSEVLGIEKGVVGVESGFFELGGHSLSLIKMKAGIKEVFNIDIPVAGLFQLTTIRALAVHIQGEETNRQVAEEILDESVDSLDETLRLLEEFEDE